MSKQNRNDSTISKLDKNIEAVKNLLELLTSDGDVLDSTVDGNYVSKRTWVNVSPASILNFLDEYEVIDGATRFVSGYLARYVRDVMEKSLEDELSEWTVSIVGRGYDETLGFEDFGLSARFGRISRALDLGTDVSIGTLVNPLNLKNGTGDELLGLSQTVIGAAQAAYEANANAGAPYAIRSERGVKCASLIIYPISPASKGTTNGKRNDITLGDSLFGKGENQKTIVGVSVVFPNSGVEVDTFWAGKAGSDKGDLHE